MSNQSFPEQIYQPFGDDLSNSQKHFAESDSYRFVRSGVYLMLAGYVLVIPSVAFSVYTAKNINLSAIGIGLFLAALFVGFGMLVIGSLLLLASPKQNEKQMARKFLLSQGLAIAIVVSQRLFQAPAILEIVQRIASAYGTYFMINYFQILANNRGSQKLLNIVQRLNYVFLALIGLAFGAVLLAGALGKQVLIWLFLIAGVYFLLVWLHTLWVAISVTKATHQREFIDSESMWDDEEWEDGGDEELEYED